jgi:hypothetical protein
LPQTTTVPDDQITSAVDHAAYNADALQSPAGLETGIDIIDTIAGPIAPAFAVAESLKGTLKCLDESMPARSDPLIQNEQQDSGGIAESPKRIVRNVRQDPSEHWRR